MAMGAIASTIAFVAAAVAGAAAAAAHATYCCFLIFFFDRFANDPVFCELVEWSTT